jgi:putative pyruvate formate lyase activating enzyme
MVMPGFPVILALTNLVTPTHVVPQILEALMLAKENGLKVPLVYNSGSYDSVETLRLLEGVFDIYEDGIAVRSLLVRHLVLPEGAAGTAEVVRFLS